MEKNLDFRICSKFDCFFHHYMSLIMRKPVFCICEKQRRRSAFVFRYTDSEIPLLSKSEISSLDCARPGRKPRRMVFSQRGTYHFDRTLDSQNCQSVIRSGLLFFAVFLLHVSIFDWLISFLPIFCFLFKFFDTFLQFSS